MRAKPDSADPRDAGAMQEGMSLLGSCGEQLRNHDDVTQDAKTDQGDRYRGGRRVAAQQLDEQRL